jgi:hypothetical protein
MKTIIAGSRTGVYHKDIEEAVANCGWEVTEVIEGGALGADLLGNSWAHFNRIPCTKMKADWDKYGKSAGYRRNIDMANVAEALIAVRVGGEDSKGTTHMIEIARDKGLRVYVLEK